MQLNLPNLQPEGREKQDIKATVTVAVAVVTFYACYLPAITYSVWRSNTKYFTKHVWVSFLVAFCTFISSASNPVIYVLRNKRYRKAIRQLVKDPFGGSSFQEKPIKKEGAGKGRGRGGEGAGKGGKGLKKLCIPLEKSCLRPWNG